VKCEHEEVEELLVTFTEVPDLLTCISLETEFSEGMGDAP